MAMTSYSLSSLGLYWNNFCGREQRVCSTAIQSLDLPAYNGKNLVVLDSRGNPLVVSGVVVYHIDDTYKATVATENYRTFIETQSEAVLKSVIGRFPYVRLLNTPALLPIASPRVFIRTKKLIRVPGRLATQRFIAQRVRFIAL